MADERKRSRWLILPAVLAASAAVFLAVDVVAGIVASDPDGFEAAIAKCQEHGWNRDDVFIRAAGVDRCVIGKTAVVRLDTTKHKPPMIIGIHLKRPINLMAWRVTSYDEGIGE